MQVISASRLSVLAETVHEENTHAVEYNLRRDVLHNVTLESGHGMDTEMDSDTRGSGWVRLRLFEYFFSFGSQLTHPPLRVEKMLRPLPEPNVWIE